MLGFGMGKKFKGFIQQGGTVFFGSVISNVCSFFYWLIMVRRLRPPDYAELNTLVSLLTFVVVPMGILQTVVTRYVSKYTALSREDEAKALLVYFGKMIAVLAAGVGVAVCLLGPFLTRFFKFESAASVYLIGVGVIVNAALPVTMGVLVALQLFGRVSWNGIVSGLVKLGAGVGLVVAGFRVAGAFSGFVMATMSSVLMAFFQLPKAMRRLNWRMSSRRVLELGDIYGYFLPATLCFLSFSALTNMDVVMVKHFFDPSAAGTYSVAQTVGKIVLFATSAVSLVLFPKIIDAHEKKDNTLDVMRFALGVVGLFCMIMVAGCVLFPEFVLRVLTGHDHPEAVALVKFFSVNMGLLSLVNIFMVYHLSLHRMRYIYLMAAAASVEFVALWAFHGTLFQVASVMCATAVFLFVAGLLCLPRRGGV